VRRGYATVTRTRSSDEQTARRSRLQAGNEARLERVLELRDLVLDHLDLAGDHHLWPAWVNGGRSRSHRVAADQRHVLMVAFSDGRARVGDADGGRDYMGLKARRTGAMGVVHGGQPDRPGRGTHRSTTRRRPFLNSTLSFYNLHFITNSTANVQSSWHHVFVLFICA